jgi:acyl-coenzyme A synthetase/AMP-(fatty) acid ligase
MPDAAYGQDIAAFVVLKPNVNCTEKDLHEHCMRELGRFKTPKVFRIVAELPKGASGKVQRLKLLESPFGLP